MTSPQSASQPLLLSDVRPRPRIMHHWERLRKREVHWAIEMFAEGLGVYCYVFCGGGAIATFVCGNILQLPGLGSLYNIGLAYGLGIVFGVLIATHTAGGHLNPALTITAMLFQKYPIGKGIRMLFAQILGAYVAYLLVYAQFHDLIKEAEAVLIKSGTFDVINFTPSGPAGIFGVYKQPTANIGYLFLNEFMVDVFVAMVIFVCLDPTNPMISPVAAPFIIGLSYSVIVWAFAAVGISTNTARDLGGRFVAMTIYGKKAWGGPYAAVAALTNIPATIFAYMIYEFVLMDSSRFVTESQKEMLVSLGTPVELVKNGSSRTASLLEVQNKAA